MSLGCRLAILVALAACGHREAGPIPTPAPDILVSIRADTVEAPDSVGTGWARVRVEEDGRGHIGVMFRLSESMMDAEVAIFLAALDTASTTPPQAMALGGPEVGDVGEVVVQLTPGRYLIGCVRRGRQGHRHASTGEAKLLVVTGGHVTASRESPPTATQQLRLVDFAYVGPDRWLAGPHMLRIENSGSQEHQLRLALLRSGASIQEWMNATDPGDAATTVAGVARMGPGTVAYLPVELAAGNYVAYCLITDPNSGREHVEMGMFRAIQIEARATIH